MAVWIPLNRLFFLYKSKQVQFPIGQEYWDMEIRRIYFSRRPILTGPNVVRAVSRANWANSPAGHLEHISALLQQHH